MSIFDWLSQLLFSYCGLEPLPAEPGVTLTTLDWMEQSALGSCIAQTPQGYYIFLAIHSIGLAMIVGALLVVDLRILGAARGISARALPKLVTIGWWGFWINAISGVVVFFSEANKMFYDNTFRWKLFLILIGVITTYILSKSVLKPAAAGDIARLDTGSAKAQAIFSIMLWVAVIVVGRMIAYLTEF
jgi:hypothetical protein